MLREHPLFNKRTSTMLNLSMQFHQTSLSLIAKLTTLYCATLSFFECCPTATKKDRADSVVVEPDLERMDVKTSCAAQFES